MTFAADTARIREHVESIEETYLLPEFDASIFAAPAPDAAAPGAAEKADEVSEKSASASVPGSFLPRSSSPVLHPRAS